MTFCKICGTQIKDGADFCAACGGTSQSESARQTENTAQQEPFFAKFAVLNDTADSTEQFEAQDIQANKAMAILSYLGILVLLPLFAAKESKYARFHANQGLILAITEIAYNILISIMLTIFWQLYLIALLCRLVGIAFVVLSVIGIMNAASGRAKELPFIGGIRILK